MNRHLSDDEFWARIFPRHDAAKVAAGVKAAAEHRDQEILSRLDEQLTDPLCEISACKERAVTAVYCRHINALVRVVCSEHREIWMNAMRSSGVCGLCRHHGTATTLWRWVPIFTTRSTT